jgi:hypothetical protein
MMKSDIGLSETIESVHRLMLSSKRIKNAAVLDAYTIFHPTLYVKTIWSGKFKILQKLLKHYDVLITMHEDHTNPFKIEDEGLLLASFKQRVGRHVTHVAH